MIWYLGYNIEILRFRIDKGKDRIKEGGISQRDAGFPFLFREDGCTVGSGRVATIIE